MEYLGPTSKMKEWSQLISTTNHFNITVTQVYTPSTHAEEAEVQQFYEDLQNLLQLTPQIYVLFIIED